MSDPLVEAMRRAVGNREPGAQRNNRGKKPKNIDTDNASLSRQELKEKIRKLRIGNERDLGNLVEKKTVRAVISKYSELIRVYFVQYPRREAANIAAELGVEGMEKKIESMLGEGIEKGLDVCRRELKKIKGDAFWK